MKEFTHNCTECKNNQVCKYTETFNTDQDNVHKYVDLISGATVITVKCKHFSRMEVSRDFIKGE